MFFWVLQCFFRSLGRNFWVWPEFYERCEVFSKLRSCLKPCKVFLIFKNIIQCLAKNLCQRSCGTYLSLNSFFFLTIQRFLCLWSFLASIGFFWSFQVTEKCYQSFTRFATIFWDLRGFAESWKGFSSIASSTESCKFFFLRAYQIFSVARAVSLISKFTWHVLQNFLRVWRKINCEFYHFGKFFSELLCFFRVLQDFLWGFRD